MNIKCVIIILLVTKLIIIELQAQSGKVKLTQKNAEKTEQIEKRYYQRARKEVIKERKKMQNEETQKRMKEASKRARKFNRRHNDIFFIKLLKKREKM